MSVPFKVSFHHLIEDIAKLRHIVSLSQQSKTLPDRGTHWLFKHIPSNQEVIWTRYLGVEKCTCQE